MSNPNRPQLPYNNPYHVAPSSEFAEHEGPFGDWAAPQFSQPSFEPFADYEMIPGFAATSPAGTSHIVPGERPLNSKVAIPRASSSNWTGTGGRVSHACENCRTQKAKCSGHKPTCQRCQEAGIRCSYGDRVREKREKMIQQVKDLTTQVTALQQQVQVYEGLLHKASPQLDAQSAQHVDQVVKEASQIGVDIERQGAQDYLASPSMAGLTETTPISSPRAYPSLPLDYTNEDFDSDEKLQSIGFLGEHSEIAWMYRLKQALEKTSGFSPRENGNRLSVASVIYFLDDSDVPVLQNIQRFEHVPNQLADQLLDTYFKFIHPSFPIINKTNFLDQYKSYQVRSSRPSKRWFAILSLVLAIATKAQHRPTNNDEVTDASAAYFSRAWSLSNNNVSLLDNPNLEQVQVEGLMSFYLLLAGHVNRSWRMCGLSIRSAMSMGLNLQSESNAIRRGLREIRYRVWWSIYMLDTTLSVMTGRSPTGSDNFCTTPLPVPFTEECYLSDYTDETVVELIEDHEARNVFMGSLLARGPGRVKVEGRSSPETLTFPLQSAGSQSEKVAFNAMEILDPNTSLYFLYVVDIGMIVRESVNALYAPEVVKKSWREIEAVVTALNEKADAWLSRLPQAFRSAQGSRDFENLQSNLAVLYHSTKLLISKPSLGRVVRQSPGSEIPGGLIQSMAAMCVESAAQILDRLPDSPDITRIHLVSPYSGVLHYIMQSITVLLIEMLFIAEVNSDRFKWARKHLSKGARWLAQLSSNDRFHQRAWLVCKDLLLQHVYSLDIASYADSHIK